MNLHGGRGCYDPIHPNSESDDTEMDLRWVRDKAGKHASSILRNCKLLLCSVQDGVEHPLDHPLIVSVFAYNPSLRQNDHYGGISKTCLYYMLTMRQARMTPTYPTDVIEKFSLTHDIAIPNEALIQLGIDIFANHNYDTWVIFTIEARSHNNSCGDPTVNLLSPLFSLFNHSCSPNVIWSISDDHQSVTLQAQGDVRRREQLFVRYDGFTHDLPVDERRERLRKWLDGPCQCERCAAEESQLKDGVASKTPEWDSEEKPIFPEDFLNLKN